MNVKSIDKFGKSNYSQCLNNKVLRKQDRGTGDILDQFILEDHFFNLKQSFSKLIGSLCYLKIQLLFTLSIDSKDYCTFIVKGTAEHVVVDLGSIDIIGSETLLKFHIHHYIY